MAQIVINEISQNYSYSIGNSSYATVALPITACWGPAYVDPESVGKTSEEVLESVQWQRFPATQEGLESFVATYRGTTSNYRLTKDYSYLIAMTLLVSGYDVLTCRVCPGTFAQGTFTTEAGGSLVIKAKYPGSFGNNLLVVLNKVPNYDYWNLITYVIDSSGTRTAVENLTFVFDLEKATDTVWYIDEVESSFLNLTVTGSLTTDSVFNEVSITLAGGADRAADGEAATMMESAITYAKQRYQAAGTEGGELDSLQYIKALNTYSETNPDVTNAALTKQMEWTYTAAYEVYELLKDKLSYSPNRIISPGWDDQNISAYTDEAITNITTISPLHVKLLDVAYNSRCATSYIDVPKSLPRGKVFNEDSSSNNQNLGYAQRLSRIEPTNALYPSHAALFAPWGQYTYVTTSKMNEASPSFLALIIERAMILNQSIQYEWALPTTRRHTLNIGKLSYNITKHLLDEWQSLEGVGVNAITNIPDMGVSLWGNSTLYEVPPSVYQALANLSTRKLVNAVEDLAYRCGIGITFQYNNDQAYNAFYAGMTPLLDTMKNVGAIDDYKIQMSADINGVDRINANTVVGKIYLVIRGVVNDIYIDLVCLPPGTDLDSYI